MGQALGLLQWTPQTFWSATPHEFFAAWEVYAESNFVQPDNDGSK